MTRSVFFLLPALAVAAPRPALAEPAVADPAATVAPAPSAVAVPVPADAAVPSGWAPRPVEEVLQRASELDLRRPDPSRAAVAPDRDEEDEAEGAGDAPALDELEADAPAAEPRSPDGRDPLLRVLPSLAAIVAEPVRGVASSGFGWRDDPIRHRRRFHRGSDFRAPRGTPVYAAGAGEVAFAGRRRGYGRMIDVRHADGLLTRYAHLERIDVKAGEAVGEGAPIGLVGSSGRATGPHLHFEVRLLGRAVDPQVAVRVGELTATATEGELHLAALALRAEAQEATVSAIDPPRARAPHRQAKAAARKKKARRPNA